MTDQLDAAGSVTATLLRALERAAKLYEEQIAVSDGYNAKLTEDGVRLATALDRLRKACDETARNTNADASIADEKLARELLTRLEVEIEATIAQRLAAFANELPAECPKCGAQLPNLATSQKPAATGQK
ncbi:MAG: hypothetical protein AAFR39_04320 [Pseudomonadota bacterium]